MATWTEKTDGVDTCYAADINRLQTLKADIVKAPAAAMGSLDEGEFGLETDTRRVLIGSSVGNTVVGGAPAWGAITGTLSAQTDLDTALDGKALVSHGHGPSEITGTAIVEGDSRLTNARTPTTHSHPESDITSLVTDLGGKAASSHGHAPGDITGTAVVTADSRLSDSRTPTAHGHAPSDVTGTAVVTNDARLSDARTPTAHNHAGTDINSGTLDGDRLPALSTTKRGGVKETGAPSGKFLKDDDTWGTPPGGVTMKITAAATVTINNATSKSTTQTGYTKVKEIKINETWPGSWTCAFTITGDSTHLAYGKVYVNEVAKGAEHSSFEPDGEAFTDDITLDLAANDLIQIYAHRVTGGTCAIKNMSLKYRWDIKAIGGKTLSTALQTTDTTVISTTNQDPA